MEPATLWNMKPIWGIHKVRDYEFRRLTLGPESPYRHTLCFSDWPKEQPDFIWLKSRVGTVPAPTSSYRWPTSRTQLALNRREIWCSSQVSLSISSRKSWLLGAESASQCPSICWSVVVGRWSSLFSVSRYRDTQQMSLRQVRWP